MRTAVILLLATIVIPMAGFVSPASAFSSPLEHARIVPVSELNGSLVPVMDGRHWDGGYRWHRGWRDYPRYRSYWPYYGNSYVNPYYIEPYSYAPMCQQTWDPFLNQWVCQL